MVNSLSVTTVWLHIPWQSNSLQAGIPRTVFALNFSKPYFRNFLKISFFQGYFHEFFEGFSYNKYSEISPNTRPGTAPRKTLGTPIKNNPGILPRVCLGFFSQSIFQTYFNDPTRNFVKAFFGIFAADFSKKFIKGFLQEFLQC